jgi:hypothetical protein
MQRFILPFLVSVLYVVPFSTLSSQSLFYEDFENTNLATIQALYEQTGSTQVVPENSFFGMAHAYSAVDLNNNGTTNDDLVFKDTDVESLNGNNVIKFSLDRVPVATYNTYSGNTSIKNHMIRNEFATYNRTNYTFKPNTTYWFGWKNYLHANYDYTNAATTPDITGQFILSDESLVPFAIKIINGKWSISTHSNGSTDLSNISVSTWSEWKVQVVFSDDTNGLINVWKDDVLVYSETGANLITDENFYLKIGVYKPGWFWSTGIDFASNKTIYYDEVWASEDDYTDGLSLLPQECSKSLTFDDMTLSTKTVDNNPTYTFQFTDLDDNSIDLVSSSTSTVDLLNETWLEKNKTYDVKVKIDGHADYGTYSANTCQMEIPSTFALSLSDNDCSKTISSSDMNISTIAVAGNPTYKFRLSNQSTGQVFFINSSSPTVDLSGNGNITHGTSYSVKVRIDNHTLYGSYSSQGCIITYDALLPVDLIRFYSQSINNAVQLNWETTNENNHLGFEIQKSNHLMNWKKIGYTTSKETNDQLNYYTFTDLAPAAGSNY